MKPGRALDNLVAEKVMGFDILTVDYVRGYSTDIAAAWEVVTALESSGLKDSEYESFTNPDNLRTYRFQFVKAGTHDVVGYAFGNDLPHAICLAALKACGHNFD